MSELPGTIKFSAGLTKSSEFAIIGLDIRQLTGENLYVEK
jgi:hypothetical protein